jgi:hypothetical protein
MHCERHVGGLRRKLQSRDAAVQQKVEPITRRLYAVST